MAMPLWIRGLAALAIAAFFASLAGGLLGAEGYWQACALVFVAAFAVVSIYRMKYERDAAIEFEDDAPDPGPPRPGSPTAAEALRRKDNGTVPLDR